MLRNIEAKAEWPGTEIRTLPPELHLNFPIPVNIRGLQDSLQVCLLDADIQPLDVLEESLNFSWDSFG